MNDKTRRNARWYYALAFIFLIALGLRCLNYDEVFHIDGVHFQDGDSWFHMRTIHNLLHHFPHRSGFDPYSGFPTGQAVTTGPLFDLAVGSVAWIGGFGSPSPGTIDQIGAWFPAILGALITLPVFLLGQALFDPVAGIFAAALIAILPGNLLKTSRLGLPDHHVAEVFFSTLVLLFLVLALERKRVVIYTALAGISFGCFLATRPAGGFLTAGICGWAVLQCIRDHWLGRSCRKIFGIVIATLFIAWIVFLPANGLVWSDFTVLELSAGIAAVAFVAGLSMLLQARGFPRWVYAAILAVTAIAVAGVLLRLRPHEISSLVHTVGRYVHAGPALTVRELRPILAMSGAFSLKEVWAQFGSSWIFAMVAFVWLIIEAFRRDRPSQNLLQVWSALMLGGTILQNRMSYFFAVNAAVLAGYFCWRIFQAAGEKGRLLVAVALVALVIAPAVPYSLDAMDVPDSQISDWTEALTWLRTNTPEPFGDPSAFDRYYPALKAGEVFHYPASAYGIMNWWDYGHFISAVGHRIPVSNGMQTGASEAALYFLSTDPDAANAILRKNGARYIIADSTLPLSTLDRMLPGNANFRVLPAWANKSLSDYMQIYAAPGDDGSLKPVAVFYPAYYRSMLARLYLFDAKAVMPENSTWVIEYSDYPELPRQIIHSRKFETYEAAVEYMQAHPREQLVVAGLDPLKSCTPLDELKNVRLAFSSHPGPLGEDGERIETVKIFEYAGK